MYPLNVPAYSSVGYNICKTYCFYKLIRFDRYEIYAPTIRDFYDGCQIRKRLTRFRIAFVVAVQDRLAAGVCLTGGVRVTKKCFVLLQTLLICSVLY